jgi:hypothetical protein
MESAFTRTAQCLRLVSDKRITVFVGFSHLQILYQLFLAFFTDVDRLPLVSSCIIQVAPDLDEPWPIEVYDHKGKAYNVTMEPGDMVLYESHTVLHGRPFPLKGRKYVSCRPVSSAKRG